jgi:Negative regulator of sigma F
VKEMEIDELFERAAAQSARQVDAALIERVKRSLEPSVTAIRSLPPKWLLASGLILLCAGVAIAGSTRAGFQGIEKMDLLQRIVTFSALAIFLWQAATQFVAEMIPGSLRRSTAGVSLQITVVALLTVLASQFREYHTDHFVSAGVACLLTGLMHAAPAALLCWLVLRRGFAANPGCAALAAGTLGGLAGLGALELQCANFQAPHILVWHVAVIPAAAALTAFFMWAVRLLTGFRDH